MLQCSDFSILTCMKFIKTSAANRFNEPRVERYIYRQGDRPSAAPEAVVDPREALEALALDETQTALHEQALGIALERWMRITDGALIDVNNDMADTDIFEVSDNGSIYVQVERALGINAQRPVITKDELEGLGISAETAMAFLSAHVADFKALDNGEVTTFGEAVMAASASEVVETGDTVLPEAGAVAPEPLDEFGAAVLPEDIVEPVEPIVVAPEEAAEVAAESVAPTVEAIMEAYGQNGNKGGILTQVNEAMGYARGTADRITSIWGKTQARLESDDALRSAFGVALGLTETLAAPAVEEAQEAVVVPVETAPEVAVSSLDLEAMKNSEILDLVDSLDDLNGEMLQKRLNELADQLGLTFPEGQYAENGRLKIDGSVGRTTREAQRQVVEFLESHIPEEADHYISVLNDLENTTDVDEIMNAVSGNQVQARMLQRDLKLLGFYNGGIDGVLGAGSRGALESALADERFENVYQIEEAAREAEVIAEGERHGRRNPSVDALVEKIRAGEQITAADVAFTGRENGGSADRTREVMDFIEQAIADGQIDNAQASKILEMMMAEDSYPEDMELQDRIAATLHDSSARFIVGLSSINPETRIREVSVALRNRIRGRESRAALAADMLANNGAPAQSFGAVDHHAEGVNPVVEIDGHEFDMRTLTKMYILTGGGETAQGTGAVEVPIGEMSAALNVHNLVYRDGALVGTMENGCEGNLVIIPVNRQYVQYVAPAPEPKAPRGPRVTITPDPVPETPEGGGHCEIVPGHCFGSRRAQYLDCFDAAGNRISHTNTHNYIPDPTCEGNGDGDGDGCGGCGAGSGADSSEGTGGTGL